MAVAGAQASTGAVYAEAIGYLVAKVSVGRQDKSALGLLFFSPWSVTIWK